MLTGLFASARYVSVSGLIRLINLLACPPTVDEFVDLMSFPGKAELLELWATGGSQETYCVYSVLVRG